MNAARHTDRPAGRVAKGTPPTCENNAVGATTVEPDTEYSVTARPPRGRVARLRERLSSRDMAVLEALAKLRLLTGDHLQRLCVAEGSAATQARRTRALLQRLTHLHLVVRLGRRVGGVRAGSSGYVYGLTGHGQVVLDVDGPAGGRRRRVWETSPAFADHVLDVAGTFVRLVEAERVGRVDLLTFDAEPAAWRTFPGSGGQMITLKPDAYLELGIGEVELSAFVEVDRGTESRPTIACKLGVYVAYWQSGIEQARHDVFPQVIWLASNPRALQRIAAEIARLPEGNRHLFRAALLTDAVELLTTTAQGGRMA